MLLCASVIPVLPSSPIHYVLLVHVLQMLLMVSLLLRHCLYLRRCLHRIVLYSLGYHLTIVCIEY